MTRAVSVAGAPVALLAGTTNVVGAVVVGLCPDVGPGDNTLAPPRGTPALLVTRPVTVVPLWANAVDAVNAMRRSQTREVFAYSSDSP